MWQKYPEGHTFGAAVEQRTGLPSESIAGKPPAHGLSKTGQASSHSHLVTKLFYNKHKVKNFYHRCQLLIAALAEYNCIKSV